MRKEKRLLKSLYLFYNALQHVSNFVERSHSNFSKYAIHFSFNSFHIRRCIMCEEKKRVTPQDFLFFLKVKYKAVPNTNPINLNNIITSS